MPKRAVFLVNLGSPDSPGAPDVRRYLREFLGDPRVIDRPRNRFLRSLLVNQVIIRGRLKNTAGAYASIWTKEGSPLIAISRSVREKLEMALAASGSDCGVYLAMRYGKPSIATALERMARDGVGRVLLFPQYPHFAKSTWGTVVAAVREEAGRPGLAGRLRIDCVEPFYGDADYIGALVESARPWLARAHDHVLVSFHGLPERHVREADATGAHCLRAADCCEGGLRARATCYRAQCLRTARLFAERAGIAPGRWSVAFQSRLSGEPWLEPFTDETLAALPARGVRRLLVISPAFVTDCLETLEELSVEGKKTFLGAGGEFFQQIPCLNDRQAHVDFLASRARAWLGGGDDADASAMWRELPGLGIPQGLRGADPFLRNGARGA
jgi:ferrochelatase